MRFFPEKERKIAVFWLKSLVEKHGGKMWENYMKIRSALYRPLRGHLHIKTCLSCIFRPIPILYHHHYLLKNLRFLTKIVG